MDDLKLVVVLQAEGVVAVAAVGRPPRGLHVGGAPRLGAHGRRKVAVWNVPAPTSMS